MKQSFNKSLKYGLKVCNVYIQTPGREGFTGKMKEKGIQLDQISSRFQVRKIALLNAIFAREKFNTQHNRKCL